MLVSWIYMLLQLCMKNNSFIANIIHQLSDEKGSEPLRTVPFDLNSSTNPFLITGLSDVTEYAVYTIVTEKDGQSSDIYFPAVALFKTGLCIPLSKK